MVAAGDAGRDGPAAAGALVFVSAGDPATTTDATPLPAAMVSADVRATPAPIVSTPAPVKRAAAATAPTEQTEPVVDAKPETEAVKVVSRASVPATTPAAKPKRETVTTQRALGTDGGAVAPRLAMYAAWIPRLPPTSTA